MTQRPDTYLYNPENYWADRKHLLYYRYLIFMVNGLAKDAQSLIDVGAAEVPLIENFDWIPERYTIDLKYPYHSTTVTGIEADFFYYKPEKKFDFVMCCQVLEHIDNVEAFTQKLFEIGKQVLISVPYMWPEGKTPHHIHDPVDLSKIEKWTGRKPSYYVIVQEPLMEKNFTSRLICYYHPEGEKFDIKPYRDMGRSQLFEIKAVLNNHIREAIDKERDVINHENQAEIDRLKTEIQTLKRDRDIWKQTADAIINSRSWKLTAPLRKVIGKLSN